MKQFECSYQNCALIYSTKYNLDRHVNVFHKNIRFLCTVCGEKLSSAQSLKDHKYCHTGEKPYKCNFFGCIKRYRQASQLSVHKKKHQKYINQPDRAFTEFWLNILIRMEQVKTYEIPATPFRIEDAVLPPLINNTN